MSSFECSLIVCSLITKQKETVHVSEVILLMISTCMQIKCECNLIKNESDYKRNPSLTVKLE